jgi:CRP/FNR family transcriptional regulator
MPGRGAGTQNGFHNERTDEPTGATMNAAAALNVRPIHPAAKAPADVASPRRSKGESAPLPTRCNTCNLREVCLPCGLPGSDEGLLEGLVYTRKRVKRGETLFHAGSASDALYAVRSGFFKSATLLEDGRDQVTGFHMAGELLGMAGLGSDHHANDVIALEDSEVCVIPYAHLEAPALQRQLHRVMSRELVRDQGVMMLLGTMRAEERLAAFLVGLSQRFAARGYSATEFHLRMTRDELGSYLGLSLETVSRLFSRLQDEGYIAVQQKHVRILDLPRLKAAIGRAA